MIEMTFHGAAGQVTGSFHEVRVGDFRFSLDCGMFQGHRSEARKLNEEFPIRPRDLHAVVLSHAHIDHSGRLPILTRGGFDGPIYATPATRDLLGVMLPDSAHIQEEDAKFWNTRRAGEGEYIEPLYTVGDARATMPLIRPVVYDKTFQVGPDCRVTFSDAGHLLGSAMVLMEIGVNGSTRRVLFSGDLGRFDVPILRDPQSPLPEVDYLITECTYADRHHDKAEGMKARLREVIERTRAGGGKIIIPSFSVGRTQEVVYFLRGLFEDGMAPLPVFVDSPMSSEATKVFSRHPECFDDDAREELLRDPKLFEPDGVVRYVTDVEDSKGINDLKEPCVILSASGMCESGRILHHLKNNVENPLNTIVVVGFMAQHTLGRRIVERREEIRIFGRMYKLLARVEILNGFSAHADADDFRRMYQPIAGKLRKAIAVHGEETQPAAMAALLTEMGCPDVAVPHLGQTIRLE